MHYVFPRWREGSAVMGYISALPHPSGHEYGMLEERLPLGMGSPIAFPLPSGHRGGHVSLLFGLLWTVKSGWKWHVPF